MAVVTSSGLAPAAAVPTRRATTKATTARRRGCGAAGLIMPLLIQLSCCAAQRGYAAQPQYSAGGAGNDGAAFLQAALTVALNPAVDQAAAAAFKVLANTAVQGGTRSGSYRYRRRQLTGLSREQTTSHNAPPGTLVLESDMQASSAKSGKAQLNQQQLLEGTTNSTASDEGADVYSPADDVDIVLPDNTTAFHAYCNDVLRKMSDAHLDAARRRFRSAPPPHLARSGGAGQRKKACRLRVRRCIAEGTPVCRRDAWWAALFPFTARRCLLHSSKSCGLANASAPTASWPISSPRNSPSGPPMCALTPLTPACAILPAQLPPLAPRHRFALLPHCPPAAQPTSLALVSHS